MLRIRLAVLPIAFLASASLRGAVAHQPGAARREPRSPQPAEGSVIEPATRLRGWATRRVHLVSGGYDRRGSAIATGIAAANRPSSRKHFASLTDELKTDADGPARLDGLLRQLHERVLIGEYRADYSELPKTLDEGHYNCVTATLLFQAISDRCGIKTAAIAVHSHVLCCVPGQPTLYVETTCRDWRSSTVDGYSRSIREQMLHGRD